MSASVLFDAPGPRARRRHLVLTVVAALALAGVLAFVLVVLGRNGDLAAEKWRPFLESASWQFYLLPGLLNTLKAAALSVVLAIAFGLVFGMGRLSHQRAVRWLCGVVVEFFRAIPVLVMMIFFFGVYAYRGVFTPELNPFFAVVTALTLYNGAVIAELVRSGVHGLPRGQGEAGLSIGLTPGQTLRSIELPQAITAMLPALISQIVVITKDSALGSVITYTELLSQGRTLSSSAANPLQTLLVVAVIFIVLNWLLTLLAQRVQQRLAGRGRTAGMVRTAAPTIVEGGGAPGEFAENAAQGVASRLPGQER